MIATGGLAPAITFHGEHQAGILSPVARQSATLAFDVIAADRNELTDLLRTITDRARFLTGGGMPEPVGITAPPSDSGVLGATVVPDGLLAMVGVGASLFDDRFGLADRKPKELETMPFLANDRLDPKLTHGDISIILEAGHNDTVQFALRQLMRRTRSELTDFSHDALACRRPGCGGAARRSPHPWSLAAQAHP